MTLKKEYAEREDRGNRKKTVATNANIVHKFPLLLLKGTSCPQVCYILIIFSRQHHNSGFDFLVAETESNMSRLIICSEVRGTYKNKQTSTAIVLLPPRRPLRMTTSSEYYDERLLLLLFVT